MEIFDREDYCLEWSAILLHYESLGRKAEQKVVLIHPMNVIILVF